MGLVLDTSALVELERLVGHSAGRELPWDEELIVPAIVWAEALVGVRLADSPLRAAQRRGRLEGLRLQVEIEPFTTQIAEHYADIFAELMQGGQMIPQNDTPSPRPREPQVSASSPVRKTRSFRRVPGLVVEVLRAKD